MTDDPDDFNDLGSFDPFTAVASAVDLSPARISLLDEARRRSATNCRLRAAGICLDAEGYRLPWPQGVTKISEELIAATQHVAVADCLANWVLHPELIKQSALVATTQIGSGPAADAHRTMWRAYYYERVETPMIAAMMDALRDLGFTVHDSWPKGRPL